MNSIIRGDSNIKENFILYNYWLIICTSETFSCSLHSLCTINTLFQTIWKLKHSLFKKRFGSASTINWTHTPRLHHCWSVNFFRHTMHSKSLIMNLAEPSWSTFGKQVAVCNSQLLLIFKKAVPIHLLIIHCFISLQLFSKNKWSFYNNSSYISTFVQRWNWKWIATDML